jgi:hypothetical protein
MNFMGKRIWFWLSGLTLFFFLLSGCQSHPPDITIPITAENTSVFLPLLFKEQAVISTPLPPAAAPTSIVPLIHVPYKNVTDYTQEAFTEMAVFWFGKVTANENYSDVRIGYTETHLSIYIANFDRLLWYDTTPSAAEIPDWDSVALYLLPANTVTLQTNQTFRLSASLAPNEVNRNLYQSAARWDGSQWATENITFATVSGWRGDGINTADDDNGWNIKFSIPFQSLNLTGKPVDGTIWRMGIMVYDRDYLTGKTFAPKTWPPSFSPDSPAQWGNLSFRFPISTPKNGTEEGKLTIVEGQNGIIVEDASVGGHSTCGDGTNFWTEWGERVTASPENQTLVIQNQRDIADWPCYSKYYVIFPINGIPQGKTILSATMTLHQYGNSGTCGDDIFQPYHSLIQVGTTETDWSEATLNWNNAPILLENVSRTWVEPLCAFPGWPGVANNWDLTNAVQKVYSSNQTDISLAVYSADGAYHSGKYFSTSETPDWNAAGRPRLEIVYGIP